MPEWTKTTILINTNQELLSYRLRKYTVQRYKMQLTNEESEMEIYNIKETGNLTGMRCLQCMVGLKSNRPTSLIQY